MLFSIIWGFEQNMSSQCQKETIEPIWSKFSQNMFSKACREWYFVLGSSSRLHKYNSISLNKIFH